MSSNGASALVPEEEYLAGDWLEDDLGEIRPKKKRRIHLEQNGIRGEDVSSSSAARGHNRSTNSDVVSRGIFGFYLCLSFTKEVKLPPHFCNSSLQYRRSFFFQQGSLFAKEQLREAPPSQIDSDTRGGETRKARSQQATKPHNDR